MSQINGEVWKNVKSVDDAIALGMPREVLTADLQKNISLKDSVKNWAKAQSQPSPTTTTASPVHTGKALKDMSMEELLAYAQAMEARQSMFSGKPRVYTYTLRNTHGKEGRLGKGNIGVYSLTGKFPLTNFADTWEKLFGIPAAQWESLPAACTIPREILSIIHTDNQKPRAQQTLAHKVDLEKPEMGGMTDADFTAKYGMPKVQWETFRKAQSKEKGE